MAKPDADQPATIPADPRVLLIRLKSIGDILFTLPAVNAVRNNFPSAKITFLTSKENAPLLCGFRAIDDVISLDRATLRSGNPLKIVPEFFGLIRRLRAGKFDLVVDFQGYGETAWLSRLTGAPERWGCVPGRSRRWGYTHGICRNYQVHPAEWNLSLLGQCGLPPGKIVNEFMLPDSALNEAHRFFAGHQLNAGQPTLFLQPFTSSTGKDWPLDRQIALARHWQQRGLQILFGGGPAEQAALEPVRQAGFLVSAGAPLLVTGGLMKLSTLVVGGDTGLLHLAVALGKRVLMLIIKDSPGKSVPFGHPDWIVVPSSGPIMQNIGLEQVVLASMNAFSERGVVMLPSGGLPR
jgi:ADP-heptose:LPS heptosyltransferase